VGTKRPYTMCGGGGERGSGDRKGREGEQEQRTGRKTGERGDACGVGRRSWRAPGGKKKRVFRKT